MMVFLRRVSQVFFLLAFIYILWSTTYPLKGVLPPDTFFKINPLIMIITSISQRLLLPGMAFCAAMLALTLLLGRFFCGWVCPLGTAVDIAGAWNKKGLYLGEPKNRRMRRVKFYVFLLVAALALSGIQIAWVLDPMVIMARFISLNLIPSLTFALDRIFILLIKGLHFGGLVHDFYRALKSSLLGVNIYYFSNSLAILLFFMFILSTAFLLKRFWCRVLCPLGALYSLIARFALLRRVVKNCVNCRRCKSACRMGAIRDDSSYIKGECILCMDCLYDCPQQGTVFRWAFSREKSIGGSQIRGQGGITRGDFIFLLFSSFFLAGAKFQTLSRQNENDGQGYVIRPPGALREREFLNRCIRCGNCMKVCITNGLQPLMFEAGVMGIWTPRLVPEIGYCEYNCTLCGKVCPTGAIPSLSSEGKRSVRLGLAEIDRRICLPWSQKKECLVCEEHCPVFHKAIKLEKELVGGITLLKPRVDSSLCVGCGICQNKCPVRPVRAIRVFPLQADRG